MFLLNTLIIYIFFQNQFFEATSSLYNSNCHYSCSQCKTSGFDRCEVCSGSRSLRSLGSYLVGLSNIQKYGICECFSNKHSLNYIQDGCVSSNNLTAQVGNGIIFLLGIALGFSLLECFIMKRITPVLIVIDFAQILSLGLFINQYKILNQRTLLENLSYMQKFNRIQIFQGDSESVEGFTKYKEEKGELALLIQNNTFIINSDVLLFANIFFFSSILFFAIFVCKNCEKIMVFLKQALLFTNYVTIQEIILYCCIGLQYPNGNYYNKLVMILYLLYELGICAVAVIVEKKNSNSIDFLFDQLIIGQQSFIQKLTNNFMVFYISKKVISVFIVYFLYNYPQVALSCLSAFGLIFFVYQSQFQIFKKDLNFYQIRFRICHFCELTFFLINIFQFRIEDFETKEKVVWAQEIFLVSYFIIYIVFQLILFFKLLLRGMRSSVKVQQMKNPKVIEEEEEEKSQIDNLNNQTEFNKKFPDSFINQRLSFNENPKLGLHNQKTQIPTHFEQNETLNQGGSTSQINATQTNENLIGHKEELRNSQFNDRFIKHFNSRIAQPNNSSLNMTIDYANKNDEFMDQQQLQSNQISQRHDISQISQNKQQLQLNHSFFQQDFKGNSKQDAILKNVISFEEWKSQLNQESFTQNQFNKESFSKVQPYVYKNDGSIDLWLSLDKKNTLGVIN